jgi:hypothetical protein
LEVRLDAVAAVLLDGLSYRRAARAVGISKTEVGDSHEHELLELSGLGEVLDGVEVTSLLDRGFRGMAKARQHWHAPVGEPPHHRPPHLTAAGL